MRAIGRAAGRVTRGILWVVKGLLLLVAVGALVMWPMSRGEHLSERVDWFDLSQPGWHSNEIWFGCDNGRVFAFIGGLDSPDPGSTAEVQWLVARHGGSWRWQWLRSPSDGEFDDLPEHLGPIRWGSVPFNVINGGVGGRAVLLPCWLVALAAGAWPLASLTLLLRRRRRRRRRRRERSGRCPQCNYDCRATADPAGPRLARCPECGAAVPPRAGR